MECYVFKYMVTAKDICFCGPLQAICRISGPSKRMESVGSNMTSQPQPHGDQELASQHHSQWLLPRDCQMHQKVLM